MRDEIAISFVKAAAVMLQPHQVRLQERLRQAPGVLAYWGLGSGKSIGSIAGAESQDADAVAVVPAALRPNYRKELDKVKPRHKFHVTSYEGFDPQMAEGRTLVVDEGQRTKNPGSTRAQAVFAGSQLAKKRIVLSGTPIPNAPEDLGPVMNIVAGKRVLPVGDDFRKKFLRETVVSPGILGYLRGAKPGVEYNLANREELARRVRGLVDYHPSSKEGFPSVAHVHRDVEMDPRQKAVYQQVLKNAPPGFFHKMERRLPPSKSEAAQLNAFLTGSRIASNTPAPYQKDMSHDEGYARSPKLQRIVNDVVAATRKNPNHRAVIYSNFLDGGIQPISAALNRHGVRHHVFTGGLSDKNRSMMVNEYNEGKSPVLLISGAGAEGLDLKGTRAVHIVEPHWNKARIKQVIGRAVRYKSHDHLPESERHVTVHTYHSVVPRTLLQRVLHKSVGSHSRATSTDQYLDHLADRKQKLIDQFNSVLQAEGSRPVKTAEARSLTGYTYVPPAAWDSIRSHGLHGARSLLSRPDLLTAARPDAAERKEWLARVSAGVRDRHNHGPHIFFTPPDQSKIGPKHHIRRQGLVPVAVDIGALLRDEPKTRLFGVELTPHKSSRKPSDRERILRRSEIQRFSRMRADALWRHNNDPENKFYAADVPHAAVITPTGVVHPRYLRRLASEKSL